jgi:hypothetical protein
LSQFQDDELGPDVLDGVGFAAEFGPVVPVVPSSKHLVVTPGDGITAEMGYLRWG